MFETHIYGDTQTHSGNVTISDIKVAKYGGEKESTWIENTKWMGRVQNSFVTADNVVSTYTIKDAYVRLALANSTKVEGETVEQTYNKVKIVSNI